MSDADRQAKEGTSSEDEEPEMTSVRKRPSIHRPGSAQGALVACMDGEVDSKKQLSQRNNARLLRSISASISPFAHNNM